MNWLSWLQKYGIIYWWYTPWKSHLQSKISFCCHRWVQSLLMSASSTTGNSLWSSHSGWWALIVHVCASATMPSKCHLSSPVWSLRGRKWIKSIDCTLNSPWKIGGFFFVFIYVFNKGNIFYLLTSYYLNRKLIC